MHDALMLCKLICIGFYLTYCYSSSISANVTEKGKVHPMCNLIQKRILFYSTPFLLQILNYVCSNNAFCDDDPDAEPGKRVPQLF